MAFDVLSHADNLLNEYALLQSRYSANHGHKDFCSQSPPVLPHVVITWMILIDFIAKGQLVLQYLEQELLSFAFLLIWNQSFILNCIILHWLLLVLLI
jgi:hypothetical protein